jgi:hypothetical protein
VDSGTWKEIFSIPKNMEVVIVGENALHEILGTNIHDLRTLVDEQSNRKEFNNSILKVSLNIFKMNESEMIGDRPKKRNFSSQHLNLHHLRIF